MTNKFSMDDYIDVAERIVKFSEKYPEGSLQTIDWEIKDVKDKTFIVYRAAAYRTANDKRPGHGIAWEPFPGPTPYTKDSELMNAETAAWGRAIVACGLPASRKIASKQEVQARQAPAASPPSNRATITKDDAAEITALLDGLSNKDITTAFNSVGLDARRPLKEVPVASLQGLLAAVGKAKATA